VGGGAIKLALWPEQRKVIDAIVSSPLLIILKARQLGLTWLVAAYCLWLSMTKSLQHNLIISMGETEAQEFIELRMRFIYNRLPDWLSPHLLKDTSEKFIFRHIEQATGKPLDSINQSLPTTPKGGQSKTPSTLVIDEACWNRYAREVYTATRPGIEQAKGQIIVISNSIKTAPGWPWTRSIYQGSMRGENDFRRIFLPWWANPMRPRETFKATEVRAGMTDEDFSQHYPETEEEAISTMLGSYFGRTLARHNQFLKGAVGDLLVGGKRLSEIENLQAHLRNTDGEIKFIQDPRGILEVWRFPYYLAEGWRNEWYTKRYGIGGDVSEGLGLSWSVAYGIDRLSDEFCFRLRTNRIDAYRWADYLYILGKWYRSATTYTERGLTYSDALICVERTGPGQTTVKRLSDLNANQYVTEVPGTMGAPLKKTFGWSETAQAKHDLSEDLRHYFRVTHADIYCPILIDEASTWIQVEGTRRLEPEEGAFGDCIIAAGCTIQASNFLGGSPQILKPPLTGWKARLKKEKREGRAWAL